MRTRCERKGWTQVQLVGPRLVRRDDMVAAMRLSAGGDGECVVVLVCDDARRVILALDFAGAPAVGAPQVVEVVLAALVQEDRRSLAVGLFTTGGGEPPSDVVDEIRARCCSAGVALLDVVTVDIGD